MKVKFNQMKTRIMFITETPGEYKSLSKYPAFLKEGPYFYVPAKVTIAYNVVHRVLKKYKKLKVDKDVMDFIDADFVLKKIPEAFKFITTPVKAQMIALRYMYTQGSSGLLMDPGMGKSKVVLDFIALMKMDGKIKKSLLVCPKPLLFVWEDEVAKHRPDLTIHVVKTTDWEKEWEQGKDKDIICVNYNKAVDMSFHLKQVGFDFIHLDEFLIKDPSTDRTKRTTELSKYIPYRCGGSGTLINNSLLDAFSPIRYLEPSLVGGNFTDFMREYTVIKQKDLTKPGQVVAYRGKDEVRSILESCCIVMTKEEWLDLPPKVFKDIHVTMSEDQREFYYKLLSNYIASIEGVTVEVDNALVMMAKLFQVANGFIYTSNDKEELSDLMAAEGPAKKKKRTTTFFKEQPKIAALEKLLDGECAGKRGIIWFNMEAEFTLIKDLLERKGIVFTSIKGGDGNVGNKVREFNSNPNIPWLVAQAKSVNYGITVLGTTLEKLEDSDIEIPPDIAPEVHTQIFYSCNFSLEVYLQQQDRIHRIGQVHQCNYYRIFTNSPVEKKIRVALDDKMAIRQDMLIDIAEKLKEDSDFLV